jgi:16S rRNA (adenine1518-N6/adenine1519-N6)-dimethyltransferase
VGAGPGGVSPAEIRRILDRHGLRARRDLGQNFLADERLAAKLAERAGVGPDDAVLEIGCGLGVLTRALAARARRVVALEIDAGLVRAILAEGGLPPGAELVHADALEVDLRALLVAERAPRRVVANLPYAVASPLLRRLLELRDLLVGWSVMVQREVAGRLVASPGTRDYGSLTVLHQLVAKVERAGDVHPRCFWPVPEVTSAFVRVEPLPGAPGAEELAAVERLARAGFAHRRKTLANSLRDALGAEAGPPLEAALARAGIAPGARAETLPPDVWLALSRALAEARAGAA